MVLLLHRYDDGVPACSGVSLLSVGSVSLPAAEQSSAGKETAAGAGHTAAGGGVNMGGPVAPWGRAGTEASGAGAAGAGPGSSGEGGTPGEGTLGLDEMTETEPYL